MAAWGHTIKTRIAGDAFKCRLDYQRVPVRIDLIRYHKLMIPFTIGPYPDETSHNPVRVSESNVSRLYIRHSATTVIFAACRGTRECRANA